MISASPKASQPHSHPIPSPSHHTINLGDGRLCLDSQKFRVPSLPVSSRPSDSTARRRERSIINGTAQPTESNCYNSGTSTGVHNYHQHPNNSRITFQTQNDHTSIAMREYNHNPYPSHQQSHLTSKKDNGVPSIFHQSHLSIEMQHRLQHPMPSNPSNFHQLCRSSMPVPCSSPAAATSASPKAMSPAKNALHSPARSPQLPNVSSNSQVDLSLSSPLKFYPGGFHPSHNPVSFYAAAAAAAASHHGIPYPLFGNHFSHPAAAAANSYNFHTNFLAQVQQQKEHQMNLYQTPPSPPIRLPRTTINSPSPSSYTKFGEEIGGCSNNRSHIEHSLAIRYGLDPRSLSTFGRDTPKDIYSSLLYSGLSKGGPLGLDRTESGNSPGNNNRQCAVSEFTTTSQLNDERRCGVNSKFWNDSSLSTGIAGKAMMFPVEQDLRIVMQNRSHERETLDSCSNNRTMLNGREGSLKHRFLTRSPEQTINSPIKAKMSKPIFTFPTPEQNGNDDETHTSMFSLQKMDYNSTGRNDRFDNKVLHSDSDSSSVLFSNPKRPTTMHSTYTTFKNSELLPLPRPITMAANTITTDSATYLSQINKPSSTSSNLPMSPYLSPKNSAQNYSPHTPSNPSNNNNPSILRKQSEACSLNGPVDNSKTAKPLLLPIEQMPVIQAFKKGSLIQLASGQLKPVEDLKVGDFHCAAATMTDSLRILHCTIVSIHVNSSENGEDKIFCKVTMIVGAKQHQVVMDTTPAQPFFVVGRGWASCSPVTTQKILQLSCSHLKVGDICITLTKTIRVKSNHATTKVPKSPAIKYKNSTQSILSTAPRRASNLGYASKILKVTNTTSSLLRSDNNEISRASSPKSCSRVKFKHQEVPPASSTGAKRTLEQSVQKVDCAGNPDTSSKLTSLSEASNIDNFKEDLANTHNNESSSFKKRRWSDDPTNDEMKSYINSPKRPTNLSPVHILL